MGRGSTRAALDSVREWWRGLYGSRLLWGVVMPVLGGIVGVALALLVAAAFLGLTRG